VVETTAGAEEAIMGPVDLDDEFEDEELDELPVIAAPGTAATPPAPMRSRTPKRGMIRPMHAGGGPRGNTRTGDAEGARRRSIAEATGQATPATAEWREDLAEGNRDRAVGKLSRKGKTHNSGSGFGLA
jgi:hypothetical protein